MWFFPVLGFALEERLMWKKCCKYFGPEGVTPIYILPVQWVDAKCHSHYTIHYHIFGTKMFSK